MTEISKKSIFVYIINLILLFAAYGIGFGEDSNPDLEAIIDSVTRSSERSQVSKAMCPIPCPEGQSVEIEPCDKYSGVMELERESLKNGQFPAILSDESYLLESKKKGRSAYIIERRKGIREFLIRYADGSFRSEAKVRLFGKKDRFVTDYERLEVIFGFLKFKELCEYLALNRGRYEESKPEASESD